MEFERHEFTQPLYGGVNVLRVGDTLVDTGHLAPVCREPVTEALADPDRLGGVERVVLTHPHVDHVGGSQTVDALADLPHVVPEGVPAIVQDYAGYLRRARADMTRLLAGLGPTDDQWDVYFPIDDYHEEAIDVTRVVGDGDTVRLGPYDLEAIHTPGHSAQHVALWHEPSGTCLSADLVSQNGHFMYGPLYGDVGDYKASLRRVRDLEPDRLVPMHGPPMDDPRARIDDSLGKAAATEGKLLDWLDENGPFFAREFVAAELGGGPVQLPFLTLVTYEYAAHLDERGELAVDVTDEGIRLS